MGHPDAWPQSLRTALSLCLTSRYPICIIWGPRRIYFYNDAYAPIVGAKHPRALGEPYPEVWPEIWESDIRPLLEGVERTGRASWSENILLVLNRYGFSEECYFQFSFAPVRIEGDAVSGAFTTITETTAQIVDARRLKTLSALGAETGTAVSVSDSLRIAADVISRNGHDIPFALFFRHDAGRPVFDRAVGLDGPGAWREASSWGLTPGQEVAEQTLDPLAAELGDLRAGPWPEQIRRAMVLPLHRADSTAPYGYLVAGISPRRPLDDGYRSFLRLVAAQCATAAANSTALEAERERARRLAELDRAKTAFFSNVSHEFRTPLTLMLGSLEEELSAGGEGESRDRVSLAHRNGLRLLKLVNTLLDFAQLESGRARAQFVPTDLTRLTTDLVSIFESAARRAGLELVLDCAEGAAPVLVDPAMWEKIVLNLLGNALKFTFAGSIRVVLRFGDDHVELAVSDTGVGIPPEELPRIFDRFHRVPGSKSRSHEGTGIGLSLVRELAALHGGTATAESVVGRGTTMRVTIGLRRAELGGGETPVRSGMDPQIAQLYRAESELLLAGAEVSSVAGGVREAAAGGDAPATNLASAPVVLVVDDNADMRAYVSRLLDRHYRVRQACQGNEAWDEIGRELPDLVVSDIMMPECDGLELLRRVRADDRTATLPVLLLSARAGAEATAVGLESGADDYIVKPFTAAELLARVASHLRLAALRQKAQAATAASEERLRSILEQSAAGVIQIDTGGRIVLANSKWCEMFGYESNELDGLDVFQLVPPEHMDQAIQRRNQILAGDGQALAQREYVRKDGSRIWVQAQTSPLRGSDGKVIGIVAMIVDLTAKRNSELRQTMLASLAERLSGLTEERDIVRVAVEAVGTTLRSHRCYFVECYENENRVVLSENWVRDSQSSLEGEYRLFDFGGREWWARYSNGNFAVADVASDPLVSEQARNYLALGIQSYAVQPFRQQGQCNVVLGVTDDKPRQWTAEEMTFVEHVAARVWPLVERARAEKARRDSDMRFRATFNQASTILALLEPSGGTMALNRAALEAGAGGSDRLEPFWELDWWKDLPDAREAIRSAVPRASSHPVRFDTVYRCLAGGERWMDITFSYIQGGERTGLILVEGHDITELRHARAALEVARDSAVEASRAKDAFLAALSHELRTPLSPILMVASDGSTNPEYTPEVRATFELVRKNVELEARLIDDLLDLTRITRGKLSVDKRRIDGHAAVLEAIAIVQPDAAEKGLKPTAQLRASRSLIEVDPVRFQQILWNILRNAAKFTPPGGRIAVETLDDEEGNFCVRVSDTGIGLEPHELARVFDAFAQGDHAQSARQFGGLGLGLAISQRLAELHGGRIEASSQGRDKGAVFTVRIPSCGRVPGARPSESRAEPNGERTVVIPASLEILLVEDHEPTRRALTKILERRGHRVEVAGTIAEGVGKLATRMPQLLISDLGLPDGNGYQLMEEAIKMQPALVGLALSGYGMEHDLQRSTNVGFIEHLVKPVAIPTLEAAIARASARIGMTLA